MEVTTQLLEIVILFLFIATLVSLATRRLRLPYTVGLVLMGLLIGLLNRPGIEEIPGALGDLLRLVVSQVTPEFILGVLVTPLLFESAFHLRWDRLQRDLGPILTLAIPGVVITTLLVGGIVYAGTDFSLPMALVFGALMGATDPVSVIALFRSIGVPKRLQVLVEGESLFNDGTAIVIFNLVLSLARSPSVTPTGVEWFGLLADFIRVAGGGLVVGFLLGWIVSQVIGKIDDHLLETTLTTVLAYGAFLVAEQFHVSGVLAVVVAGLVNGNLGPKGMSPTTRIVVANFWEYVAFISNSVVFLLIGLETQLDLLFTQWRSILLAILAVQIARVLVIYPFTLSNRDTPPRWSHVQFWGGLRGAISLALALSVPLTLGTAEVTQLRSMAFGVVLFTILVQGFTMQPLIRRLKLIQRSELQEEYERRHARSVAAQAAYDRLKVMHGEGLFSNHTWNLLAPMIDQHAKALALAVKDVLTSDPVVESEELDTARREALRAERSALITLLRDGVVSEEIYNELVREVDVAISESDDNWAGLIKPAQLHPVKRLMAVIIQLQDFDNAVNALKKAGLSFTHVSSSGGFLGRQSVTLLIGLGENQENSAVQVLSRSCRQRVEYTATPLEGAPFHLPLATPVTVGGATIFTLEVERYEEIR